MPLKHTLSAYDVLRELHSRRHVDPVLRKENGNYIHPSKRKRELYTAQIQKMGKRNSPQTGGVEDSEFQVHINLLII